ncbi:hypothetical protein Acr_00g0060950 [Actinidia rufa]|uniref:Retrotransposon gag domain-containing protein n=1 Tax=Actinidia rufa TaxID=165716 RepID=A0A7J0DQF5_9ERIC|nr:hypothetical protein Acr_00g0060950 [Actinidia rufa]
MGPKRGRDRMVERGRGGRGATRRGTPIEDVGRVLLVKLNKVLIVVLLVAVGAHSSERVVGTQRQLYLRPIVGAGGRETAPDVPVIPSQFAREVMAAMLEMERTRHEEIRLGDHVVAGHWLSQIHKIFDIVRITEDDMKVSFEYYQLVGEANELWESIKEAKGVDRGMTWANFESTFEDQYFPEAYRDELRDQFEKLVQGDMTVLDYVIKF